MHKGERKRLSGTVMADPRSASAKPAGRVWIELDGATMMSWARATMLDRIGELGSISAAGRAMNISYAKAWRLVNEMNSMFGRPLIVPATGGKKGGGAVLTEEGRRAAKEFWRLVDEFRKWLEKQSYNA
jgi:molybdate transport system regulatory protein